MTCRAAIIASFVLALHVTVAHATLLEGEFTGPAYIDTLKGFGADLFHDPTVTFSIDTAGLAFDGVVKDGGDSVYSWSAGPYDPNPLIMTAKYNGHTYSTSSNYNTTIRYTTLSDSDSFWNIFSVDRFGEENFLLAAVSSPGLVFASNPLDLATTHFSVTGLSWASSNAYVSNGSPIGSTELGVVPVSASVNSVPEPSPIWLILPAFGIAAWRSLRHRQNTYR